MQEIDILVMNMTKSICVRFEELEKILPIRLEKAFSRVLLYTVLQLVNKQ